MKQETELIKYQMRDELLEKVKQEARLNLRTSYNGLIYAALRQEIVDGNILPCHQINVAYLADALQMSRTPIIQATQQLMSEGIIVKEKNCLHVKQISYEDALWIYESRITLEPQAAYYAASRITNEELAALEPLVDQFKTIDSSHDRMAYAKADKVFHETIVKSTKNKYLIQMNRSIELPLACYRHQLNQLAFDDTYAREDMLNSSAYHIEIFRMLKMHLPLLAQDAMKNDLIRMFATLTQLKT